MYACSSMRRCSRSLLFISVLASSAGAQASPPHPDSSGAAHAAQPFLVAFDSLRWEPFAAAWAPRASAFLPDPESPRLVTGRSAILDYFRALFSDVSAAAAPAALSLQILPAVRNLEVRMLGRETAAITFELGDGARPSRRSSVWTWDADQARWMLEHLHASHISPS